MALSAFDDPANRPDAGVLRSTLGRSHAAWLALIAAVEGKVAPLRPEWVFAGKSTGWGLRMKHGERVIVYMTPRAGSFLVSFALGERAVEAALAARLPAHVRKAIEGAPRYAEGRGVRIEVRGKRDLPALAELARLKHESGRA